MMTQKAFLRFRRSTERFFKSSQEQQGSSLIEFAVALPAMLMVVTGITTFGIALNNYVSLTDATNVAARQLALSRDQIVDPCALVSSTVYASAPYLTQSGLSFAVTINGHQYTGTTCASASPSVGAAGYMSQGANVTLQVSYPCNLTIYKTNYAPNCSMTAQTTQVVQ